MVQTKYILMKNTFFFSVHVLNFTLSYCTYLMALLTVIQMETYTYDATFFSTWLVTTWTSLFLPFYTICCLLSRQLKPSELGVEWKDSVMAFRDKGFTLGNPTN